MSGALSAVGFGSDWLQSLQHAAWRGVPFSVTAESVTIGRKAAVHDYPFRNGVWVEDLGRAPRRFSFVGYLVGDAAPVLVEVLKRVCEMPGPGPLIHPSLGYVNASLISATIGERKERLRVYEVAFEFIEQGEAPLVAVVIATAVQLLTFAGLARSAGTTDFQADAAPALAHGAPVTAAAGAVVAEFGARAQTAAADPAAAVRAVATLPGNYGRYAAGAASTPAPADATVASLIAGVTTARAAVSEAVAAAAAEMQSVTAAVDIGAVLAPILASVGVTASDPADRIRLLSGLAVFAPSVRGAGGIGIGAAIAALSDATAAAARRMAVIALAEAAAAYQPTSYQDAADVRDQITAALDAEITAAGDAGDDDSYAALRDLRTAVAADLTARGADLAAVETVTTPLPQSALTVAYAFYEDAGRADEVTRRANPPHPAFLPTVMQLLAA